MGGISARVNGEPTPVVTVIGGGITVTNAPPPTGGGIAVADVGALYGLGNLVNWVYDPTRNLFFIETSTGVIDSFDPIRQVASTVVNLGVASRGLAITPDGQALYVGSPAASTYDSHGAPTGALTRIDLSNLSPQTLTYQVFDSHERDPYSLVVGPTGQGFFTTTTSSGAGTTPLHAFSTSGAFASSVVPAASNTLVSGFDYGPLLTLSEDGRYVLITEPADNSDVITVVDAASGNVLTEAQEDSFGGSGGTSRADINGHKGLVVEVEPSHLFVLDTALHLVKDLSSLQGAGDIIGAHFNLDGSRLYLWSESAQALLVYDTTTWQEVGSIALGAQITGAVGATDAIGQMSLADNGRFLFLDTGTGFEIVDLKPGWHADDFTGDAVSDVLIQNTAGAVVLGEMAGGHLNYQPVAALGSEWRFLGSGDFLHYGVTDYLIENTAGALVVGDVAAGQTSFTQVGAVGPEWTVEGVGHFLAGETVGFLMENTAGALVLGQVANGQATYSQVGALGPEWTFRETGDFLGHGVSSVLIENGAGAVVAGEVVNGQMNWVQVAALGPEWSFVGAGDFLGDGRTDFLIHDSAGAVVAGEVVNGQAVYTQIAALGPEWRFVGAGDYLGEGHDQFLIENTNGAVVIGDYTAGQIHYTAAGALGSEWHFHP